MIIEFTFLPHFNYTWPKAKIIINSKVFFDGDCQKNDGDKFFLKVNVEDEELSDNNILVIEHYNKNNKETTSRNNEIIKDKALELVSIKLDDFAIPDVILYSQKFFPNYPKNLLKKNSEEVLPEFITNNLYFGFNGKYILEFKKDIKKWYYEILILKEKMANKNNQELITLPSGEVIETYEMVGKTIDASKKEEVSIDALYEMVKKS